MIVTFLIGLILVACVLLVLVVLAQNAKGGGLTAGAAGAGQIMGAKRAVDFLEKLTWGLGIAIFVLSLSANIIKPEISSGFDSPNIENTGGSVNTTPAPVVNTESKTPETTTPTDTTKK
jgi:preprotein translocase subunit SecG